MNYCEAYWGSFWAGRFIFQRSLAAIYLIAFSSAFNQFPALSGEDGLEPVTEFLKRMPLRLAPSIFHFAYSDRLFTIIAAAGIFISLLRKGNYKTHQSNSLRASDGNAL